MAIKSKTKIGPKISSKNDQAKEAKTDKTAEVETVVESPAMTARTMITFRTKQLTKKKAEKIFDDMGLSMSGALNLFLAQVVHDKGLPFLPTVQRRENNHVKSETTNDLGAFEDLWEEL